MTANPPTVTPEDTKEIFGSRFLDPRVVLRAGHRERILPEPCPPIPWTFCELAAASSLGYFLELRPPALSMRHLIECRENRRRNGNELFRHPDWYQNEFVYQTLTTGDLWDWILVSPGPLDGSQNLNFLQQTKLLVNYVIGLFDGQSLPSSYGNALTEYRVRIRDIEARLRDGSKAAIQELADLEANQLFRPTPVQMLEHWLLRETVSGDWPEVWSHWSAICSQGGLTRIGGSAGGLGLCLDFQSPFFSDPSLGVVFCRSGRWESLA